MMRRLLPFVVPVLLGLAPLSACGAREEIRDERRAAAQPKPTSTVSASPTPRIVFLGDSLTAGLGLNVDEAYPALVEQHVRGRGLKYDVVNAGVSGDTSAGGLSRLEWALEGNVKVLVIALGANDGLRGLPVDELKQNLSRIIEQARGRGITVVLAGMEAPPNFGREYTTAFHNVYPSLAKRYQLPLVPFLLQGVASVDGLNQRDGLHPNAQGARMLADNVWAVLGPVLEGRTARD